MYLKFRGSCYYFKKYICIKGNCVVVFDFFEIFGVFDGLLYLLRV